MATLSSAAVGQDDDDAFYDKLDPELDRLIATVTFNRTTGECSSLEGTDIVMHPCGLQVMSQGCQTYFTRPSYTYDGRAVSSTALIKYLEQSDWDSIAEHTDMAAMTPQSVASSSSSLGLHYIISPTIDVACVGVHARSLWWVLTRGVLPGIYPSRTALIEAACGAIDPVFSSYLDIPSAVSAFMKAFSRPRGVQQLLPCPNQAVINRDAIWGPSTRLASVSPARPPSLLFAENIPQYAVPNGIPPGEGRAVVVFRGTSYGVFDDW
ncbi:hypothetical protein EIP86_008328 [Pleurotus ostreatoroseus]|nr:hypothetical protein EIP86_008328 [Pleurotus ostreatoroseus]